MSVITSWRRATLRTALGATAVALATVALPGVAQAHVSVQPGEAEGGGFSVVAFRVPNERDDASTTKVRVTMPQDQPLGSVRTTPVPGWSVRTTTRKLAEPIELFGEKLDTVVADVTWTATDGGIKPGQYQDFDVSVGQLPESGEVVFNTVQTYSSGEQVSWNEVSADETAEPEHPAPVLTITPPEAAENGTAAEQTSADPDDTGEDADTRPVAAQTDDSSSNTLPVVLSAAALVVAVFAALLAWRRGRA
jgi:periplasmic copper chaperone A